MSFFRCTNVGRPLTLTLASSVLGLGCRSDSKVGVYREPPAVTIISPAEEDEFATFETVAFVALAETFDDTPVTELRHQWVAGSEVVCEWEPVPSDGNATCGISFSSTGKQSITVTVQDTRLDVATASIQVWTIDNHAPSIEITAPANGSLHEPDTEIVFQALIHDAEEDAGDLVVSGLSSEDGPLSFSSSTPSSSGEWIGSIDSLTSGDHSVTLEVTDAHGQTDSDVVQVKVNGRPTAPVVEVRPNPAISGEELKVNWNTHSIDPEGDTITYGFAWQRDGEPYPSATGDTLGEGNTKRGETWTVTVTPYDVVPGTGLELPGTPASAEAYIVNSPPTVTSVSILPGDPATSEDLVAYPSGWNDQDDDPEDYEYVWTVNGTDDPSVETDTFPGTETHKGDEIEVTVTAVDPFDVGNSVTSASVTIGNSLPRGHTVAINPPSPDPSNDLVCTVVTPAVDEDGDDIDYQFAWAVDGVPMSGATFESPIIGSIETNNAETWECTVTANDGTEDGDSASDSVYVSDGTAPDPPVLDDPAPHRNEAAVDLTGECESACTLTFTCEDALSSWVFEDTCTFDGTFGTSTSLTAGQTTTCWAYCTDPSGNVSGPSNDVSTQVCDPGDEYEAGSYGDFPEDPVDEWSVLPDDDSEPIYILGNVLHDDVDDWYIISAGDDLSQDLAEGVDFFRFGVKLREGVGDYSFLVYRDTPYPDGDDECSIDPDGYTEYEWYNQDRGDAPHHGLPTPLNSCGSSSILLNDCADDSSDFFIHVFRNEGSTVSCDPYELEITNGEGW